MKLFAVFVTMAPAFAAATPWQPASPQTDREFARVPLSPPLDWMPGPRLFPHYLIGDKVQTAKFEDYDRESWAARVRDECNRVQRCHSTISFSDIMRGGVRGWIGYLFVGGPTNVYDYRRADPRSQRRDTIAYTVVNPRNPV